MNTSTNTEGQAERLLYPIEDARQVLGGISRSTLYELMRDEVIRAVKIGRRTYIARSEMERYVASLVS